MHARKVVDVAESHSSIRCRPARASLPAGRFPGTTADRYCGRQILWPWPAGRTQGLRETPPAGGDMFNPVARLMAEEEGRGPAAPDVERLHGREARKTGREGGGAVGSDVVPTAGERE
jgi:hypothetical protein